MSADSWVAIFTGLLFAATCVLSFFTYKLWSATGQAVADTNASLVIAGRTADAAQLQAEVAERIGMIQNMPQLEGHLRYMASCALFDKRPSDHSLNIVPGTFKGYGRLLWRLQTKGAADPQLYKADTQSGLAEVCWSELIRSEHLQAFVVSARSVTQIAIRANAPFLVDRRIMDICELWPSIEAENLTLPPRSIDSNVFRPGV